MARILCTEIAPTGKFRVGMNANNATLVIRGADGTVSGLSADLGRFIAGRLGVPYEPIIYASAAALSQLTQMVNEAKAAGVVQNALEHAGAKGVRILP